MKRRRVALMGLSTAVTAAVAMQTMPTGSAFASAGINTQAQFTIAREGTAQIRTLSALRNADRSVAALAVQSRGDESAVVDTSLLDQGVLSATSPNFTDLSWQPVSKISGYVILRNGSVIKKLSASATSYRDLNVTPGDSYQYTIDPITTSSTAPIRSMAVTVPTTGQDLHTAANHQLAARTAASTTVTWETFIPQWRIPAPGPAYRNCQYRGSSYLYGGDGHGYDWKNSSFRTSTSAVVTWSNKSVNSYGATRATHVYLRSNGKLISAKTASNSGEKARLLSRGGNYVGIRMETNAGNPYCSLSAIEGAFTITVSNVGDWTISSGQHRQMPDHYVYMFSGGKETDIYKRNYASPDCLGGAFVCSYANMHSSGHYNY